MADRIGKVTRRDLSLRLVGLALLALLAPVGCEAQVAGGVAPAQTAGQETKRAAAGRDWEPQRTWAFVVGTLTWKDKESFDSFPAKDRRDAELVEFFRKAGVPQQQIVYLQDRAATTTRIEKSFSEMLSRTRPGDLLFVYYTGHGYKDENDGEAYFASYDASDNVKGWRMASLPIAIEKGFKGYRAFLLADCCYSGVLTKEVKNRAKRVAYAALASSLASELSTANWTYTESLLDALRGSPACDLDGDRRITVEELGRYAADDMQFGEEQRSAWITTAGFPPATVLSTAAPRSHPQVGKRVEVLDEGKYWKARITDADARRYRVHWLGLQGYPDEWVAVSRVRFPKTAADAPRFAVDARVEVNWKGKWYPAKVLKVEGNTFFIRYAGYGEEWDEWVSSKRIRSPKRTSGR